MHDKHYFRSEACPPNIFPDHHLLQQETKRVPKHIPPLRSVTITAKSYQKPLLLHDSISYIKVTPMYTISVSEAWGWSTSCFVVLGFDSTDQTAAADIPFYSSDSRPDADSRDRHDCLTRPDRPLGWLLYYEYATAELCFHYATLFPLLLTVDDDKRNARSMKNESSLCS